MKLIKFLLSLISKVLWILIILLALDLTYQAYIGVPVPMVFNYGLTVVQNDTMEPDLSSGTMVVIEKKDDYVPGDIIVFLDEEERTIAHRIISVEGEVITTQGDANTDPDEPIPHTLVIGKVIYCLPDIRNYFDYFLDLSFPIATLATDMAELLAPTDSH